MKRGYNFQERYKEQGSFVETKGEGMSKTREQYYAELKMIKSDCCNASIGWMGATEGKKAYCKKCRELCCYHNEPSNKAEGE